MTKMLEPSPTGSMAPTTPRERGKRLRNRDQVQDTDLIAFSTRQTEPSDPQGRARPVNKLGALITLLQSPEGATIDALCAATGWQAHSVRGALAGVLKRKGYAITSEKPEGGHRHYRIEASA